MRKPINYVKIVLENCEVIKVPFECFKEFSIGEIESIDGVNWINSVEFLIKDNGNIEYVTEWSHYDNTSPIQRLNKYNDIVEIDIYYNDNEKELIKIEWYGDDPNSNRNQKSKLQDYKTIHIKIAPPTLEEKLEMKLKYISYKKLAEMFIRELCICDLDILFENLPDISKIHDNKCRKCWDIVLENNDNEYDNSI